MLYNKKLKNIDNYLCYDLDGVTFYCDGIFFIPGYREGIESIEQLAKQYINNRSLNFIDFFGAYNFIIQDNNKYIFFTDNSHLRTFLYHENVFADNYIDIIQDIEDAEGDMKGIYQYLLYGMTFGNRTCIDNVFFTDSEHYYIVNDGKVETCRKNIGSLNSVELGITPCEFGNILRYSLEGVYKSLSLTGGFDSRYVLSLFNDDNNLISAISTSHETLTDVKIAKKVANVAGIDFETVVVNKPEVTDELIENLFYSRKGFLNCISESIYRLNYYISTRHKLGVQCIITGDTGVFHKSEDWYQDAPFYNKKHCNIKGYYNKRFINIKQNIPFSLFMQKVNCQDKEEIINMLEKNEQSSNTKSYDWFGWYFGRGSFYSSIYSSQNKLINTYSPLMEYRFVINSYNLPRKERVMAHYMKKYMTSVNPDVAEIPTATGVTASIKAKYIAKDFLFSMINLGKAALRLCGKVFCKKTFFSESATSWSFENEIPKLKIANDAIKYAIQKEWIANNVDVNSISYSVLCKIIALYLLFDRSYVNGGN